jgi:hypothetical protein
VATRRIALGSTTPTRGDSESSHERLERGLSRSVLHREPHVVGRSALRDRCVTQGVVSGKECASCGRGAAPCDAPTTIESGGGHRLHPRDVGLLASWQGPPRRATRLCHFRQPARCGLDRPSQVASSHGAPEIVRLQVLAIWLSRQEAGVSEASMTGGALVAAMRDAVEQAQPERPGVLHGTCGDPVRSSEWGS